MSGRRSHRPLGVIDERHSRSRPAAPTPTSRRRHGGCKRRYRCRAQLDATRRRSPIDGLLEARYRRYRDLGPYDGGRRAGRARDPDRVRARDFADRLREPVQTRAAWRRPAATGQRDHATSRPPTSEDA